MCLRVAWGVMLGSVLAPFTISIEGRWPSLGVYLDGVASGKSQSTASIVVCASGDVVGWFVCAVRWWMKSVLLLFCVGAFLCTCVAIWFNVFVFMI